MFEPAGSPRVFGLAPGVDFPKALVAGLEARLEGAAPEAWARVELLVNTRRMHRRIHRLFDAGPARLLPRIRLVTELGRDPAFRDIPAPASPLRRRLELTQLVAALLDQQPDLAPRAALFDLADSLARLMDEMQGEGVPPEAIAALDVSDQSGHWARALRFVRLVQGFFAPDAAPDPEARQRMVVERLIAQWAAAPPQHPVLIAGSTGSRGTTALLMDAIARLPQGAVILPGFDFDQPEAAWDSLARAGQGDDHPQARFQRLMTRLEIPRGAIRPWHATPPPNANRNRLVSLALRPAPVTDQWMHEGPDLENLAEATAKVTLLEADQPRNEATAIAMRLRQAAEEGQTAAVITPNRMITRQISAALDRWGIVPDDSAGTPLPLTPQGRFLLQVAALFGTRVTPEAVLGLLKMPVTCTGSDQRGPHLAWTRAFELWLRRKGPAFVTGDTVLRWASGPGEEAARSHWAAWVADTLERLADVQPGPLLALIETHLTLAEQLANGPDPVEESRLWRSDAGEAARRVCDMISRDADAGGTLALRDYQALFRAVLNQQDVRDADAPHTGVLIWGTLEARVQGADLVILAGLNEGSWPEAPAHDPWLNRAMRRQAGLLSPETRIGLSAHDFQQAIVAPEVWLTRARRDDDAATVPARWLNRICTLLDGLPGQGGPEALKAMRARGDTWLTRTEQLEAPAPGLRPAHRPAPRPPVAARPRQLSVTRFKTLVRDPYAIYARYVLGLKRLDPLRKAPDAPLRGVLIHDALETFVETRTEAPLDVQKERLLSIASERFEAEAPWPAARRLWLAKLARVADQFLEDEAERLTRGVPASLEKTGRVALQDLGFVLTAQADRIDLTPGGTAIVYDYKTGSPPSAKEQQFFDRQLLLEAAMLEAGGFESLGPLAVDDAAFIGLGNPPRVVPAPLEKLPLPQIWHELRLLISAYLEPDQGYTARRRMARDSAAGDYDLLARFGEWDATDPPQPEDVGR